MKPGCLLGALLLLLPLDNALAEGNERAAIGALSADIVTATAPDDSTLFEAGFGANLYLPLVEAAIRLDFASAEVVGGTRRATTFAPALGAHIESNRDQSLILQGFGQVQLPIQSRSGAGLPNKTGLALGGEVGGRIWGCSTPEGSDGGRSYPEMFSGFCMGFSLAVRYRYHLSDFQMDSAVFPQGSSAVSMPFMFLLGFNPRAF